MKLGCDFPTLPTPELRLYHSRRKCERFLRRHDVPFDEIEQADAQTWSFVDETGPHSVVLYPDSLDCNYVEDMAILAHEATHVMMFAFDRIGETEPAEEETCYMVQSICAKLCEAHFEWKAKRLCEERRGG